MSKTPNDRMIGLILTIGLVLVFTYTDKAREKEFERIMRGASKTIEAHSNRLFELESELQVMKLKVEANDNMIQSSIYHYDNVVRDLGAKHETQRAKEAGH